MARDPEPPSTGARTVEPERPLSLHMIGRGPRARLIPLRLLGQHLQFPSFLPSTKNEIREGCFEGHLPTAEWTKIVTRQDLRATVSFKQVPHIIIAL